MANLFEGFKKGLLGKNYVKPDSDILGTKSVGAVVAQAPRVTRAIGNQPRTTQRVIQKQLKPKEYKAPLVSRYLASPAGRVNTQFLKGINEATRTPLNVARVVPAYRKLQDEAQKRAGTDNTLAGKIGYGAGLTAGSIGTTAGLGQAAASLGVKTAAQTVPGAIKVVASSGALGAGLGGALGYIGGGKEGAIEGAKGGLEQGVKYAPTYQLTNLIVGKLAQSIPALKPLTDQAISQNKVLLTDTVRQAVQKTGQNAFNRMTKAILLETPFETVLYGIGNKGEQEKLIDSLAREFKQNLVFNTGFALLNGAGDSLTTARVINKSFTDALEKIGVYDQVFSPTPKGGIDVTAKVGGDFKADVQEQLELVRRGEITNAQAYLELQKKYGKTSIEAIQEALLGVGSGDRLRGDRFRMKQQRPDLIPEGTKDFVKPGETVAQSERVFHDSTLKSFDPDARTQYLRERGLIGPNERGGFDPTAKISGVDRTKLTGKALDTPNVKIVRQAGIAPQAKPQQALQTNLQAPREAYKATNPEAQSRVAQPQNSQRMSTPTMGTKSTQLNTAGRSVRQEVSLPQVNSIRPQEPKINIDPQTGRIISGDEADATSRINELRENIYAKKADVAARNEAIRSQWEPLSGLERQIDKFRRIKTDGDVVTIENGKYGREWQKLYESIMEAVPTIKSSEDAWNYIRNLPSRAKVTADVRAETQEVKAIDEYVRATQAEAGSYVPTKKTLEKLGAKADAGRVAQANNDYREWQKQLWAQSGAVGTKGKAVDVLAKSIKTSTTAPSAKNITELRDIGAGGRGAKDIYRNAKTVYGSRYESDFKPILDTFDKQKVEAVRIMEQNATDARKYVVDELGIKPNSKDDYLIVEFGEGKVTKDQLVERVGQARANAITKADVFFRERYDRFIGEINKARAQIYPNQPDKLIPKRSDYYRHGKEMTQGLKALVNIFDSPANIDPSLAAISATTRAKSKWQSIFQKRWGDENQLSAISGYVNYLSAYAHATKIDPVVATIRNYQAEIEAQASMSANSGKPADNGLNNWIGFLDDWAKDVAGNTNPFDRVIQERIPGGRMAMSVLSWVNSRVKANVILGNLSSSIAQWFNLPQAIGSAKQHMVGGFGDTLKGIVDPSVDQTAKSDFIKERYSNPTGSLDMGVMADVKRMAVWVTQVGDEVATKMTWNGHYRKAISEGISNPIKYADDTTRSFVGGRGIGEVPIMQKSKVFQMIAPFQYEVTNAWYVMGDFVKQKDFTALMTMLLASYIMNRGAKAIRGSDVVFDPIDAITDAYATLVEEKDPRVGGVRAGGRLIGEVLSNVPFGQTLGGLYPEFGMDIMGERITREELFGDADPTRFGSGLLAVRGLQDPVFKLLPGYGGQQVRRTLEGLGAVARGYSETETGRVRYPVKQNLRNALQAGAFGQYSIPEGQRYFEQDTSSLGDKQSKTLKSLPQSERQEYYDRVIYQRRRDKILEDYKSDKITKKQRDDRLSKLGVPPTTYNVPAPIGQFTSGTQRTTTPTYKTKKVRTRKLRSVKMPKLATYKPPKVKLASQKKSKPKAFRVRAVV